MKPTGTGRIVLWRGGSLWIGLGGEPTDLHSHHAVQISVSLSGGQVRLRNPDENWQAFNGVIVAAHQPHAFEARGEFVAMIFVEPESRNGRALHQRCHDAGVAALSNGTVDLEIAALAALYRRRVNDQELIACTLQVIAKLAETNTSSVAALDTRIDRAIEHLRERITQSITLAEIADIACLSPERFRHLFAEETGMRFRPYVLWLRIETALAAFVAGKSLTEASHIGGFADSAHFSRTFRRMFGITPSSFQHE